MIICQLCSSPFEDTEHLECTNQESWKSLISYSLPGIAVKLEATGWQPVCEICYNRIQKFKMFKTKLMGIEEKIRSKLVYNSMVDLKSIVSQDIDDKAILNADTLVCRTCLQLTGSQQCQPFTDNSFPRLFFRNPAVHINLISINEPVVCKDCTETLERMDIFIQNCLHMNGYPEINSSHSTNYDRTNQIHNSTSSYQAISENSILPENYPKTATQYLINNSITENQDITSHNQSVLANKSLQEIYPTSETSCPTSEANYHTLEGHPASEVCSFPEASTKIKKEPSDDTSKIEQVEPEYINVIDIKKEVMNDNIEEYSSAIKYEQMLENNTYFKEYPDDPETLFECMACKYRTKWKHYLKKHFIAEHTSLGVMFCPHCPFKTKWKAHMNRHFSIKHDVNFSNFQCFHCDFNTKWKPNLKFHIQRKHKDDIALHQCPQCEYKSKFKCDVKRHMKKHQTKTSMTAVYHSCPFCTFQTKHREYLKLHITVKHDENSKIYECPECSFKTKHKETFKRHKFQQHEQVERFKCPECDYTTKRRDYLKQHRKLRHDNDCEMFKCTACDFQTKSQVYMRQHFEVRHNKDVKTYGCPVCPYKSKRKYQLKRHFAAKHEGKGAKADFEFVDTKESKVKVEEKDVCENGLGLENLNDGTVKCEVNSIKHEDVG